MMRIRGATAAWSCLAAFALAACDQPGTAPVAEAPTATTSLFRDPVESDRPAPDVFEDEGVGIWDGRPTLGGVWIAHPLARQPERVRIENLGNGRSVIGALFRRDTALTGPAIQLSSDTARSIGIVPGEPTPIRIVALRRTVVSAEDATEEAPAEASEAATEEAPAEATADAPVDAPAEATADTTAEATEADATSPTADTPTAAETDPDQGIAAEAEAAPRDAEPAPAPVATGPGDTEESGTDSVETDDPAVRLVPAEDSPGSDETDRSDAPGAVEPSPAIPVTSAEPPAPRPRGPDPDVHVAPARTPPAQARATPVVVLSEPPAPAEALPGAEVLPETPDPETPGPETPGPEAPLAETPATLSQSYVQIGMFGIADNARRLRRDLEAEGLPVRLVERRAGGTVFTRVLIGPAASAADLQRYLDTARSRGFRDAIAVRG